jgi:hypothetical protein
MSSIAAAAEKTGLFIVTYNIGTGLEGALNFHLGLAINTVDKAVNGAGRITQAVNPPLDVRTHLRGTFTYMTVMPKQTHILVVATGTPAIDWPPSAGIGPVLPTNVELRMVLNADWKSGTAYYRYQGSDGVWHEVSDVPVKLASNA